MSGAFLTARRNAVHVVPQRKVEQSHVVLAMERIRKVITGFWIGFFNGKKFDGTKIIQNDELYHDYTID